MSVTITISDSEMRRALHNIEKYSREKQKELTALLGKTARDIDAEQKTKLRFHMSNSGNNYSSILRANTIDVSRVHLGFASVENKHKAARFIENGTRPHRIRIKNKNVLATLSEYTKSKKVSSVDKLGNAWAVFGKEVKHPGTRAYPFFNHVVLKYARIFPERVKKIIESRI